MTAAPSCSVCRGLEVVRYARQAEDRPAPFCGACGRQIDLVLVDAEPWAMVKRQRPSARTQEQSA